MNSPLGTKNRPWRGRISAVSAESSVTIPAGSPIVLNTSDLSQVKLPSTAGGVTIAHPFFAGVAAKETAPGQIVEIVAAGYCAQAKFVNRTRAASTDSWSSIAAQALGNLLTIDTVNNAFGYSTVGAAALAPHAIVMAEALASIAGSASSTANASTVQTQMVKVWLRALA